MMAGLIGAHNGKLTFGSEQRDIACLGRLIIEIHRDAGIREPHHRAHAHARSHDSISARLLK